ncbi:hypothetical protein ADL35_17340, partial [Streptomyces sp. NRRL WC-3753]
MGADEVLGREDLHRAAGHQGRTEAVTARIRDTLRKLDTLHPAMLKLVESVAKLAEAELRARHLRGLDRLRSVAAPLLARIGGRAVAVDEEGWVAAVTGMPPVDRLPL